MFSAFQALDRDKNNIKALYRKARVSVSLSGSVCCMSLGATYFPAIYDVMHDEIFYLALH